MEKSKIIRVTGKGNLKVHPDMTKITIELSGSFPEYSETLRQASLYTKALRGLLAPFGFQHSDLKTLDFSVDPKTETYKVNDIYKHRLIGYRFTHSLKLEFDSDNERLGKILYALANSSMKPEFTVSYTVKDAEAVKNKLLGRAVKDAKEKARVLTAAAGVDLGEMLSIDYSWGEINFEERSLQIPDGIMCAESAARYELDIEPDDIQTSDTVTIVWEIR